jgi:hypothetical protein
MKTTAVDENVYYEIEWSEPYKYDRISAGRILPDMPGILMFTEMKGKDHYPLFLFASWREGLRSGMKNLMDDMFSKMPDTAIHLKSADLYYCYTVIDTSPLDMKDILFWLIRTYTPEYNNAETFKDSKRFTEIAVKETKMRKN